MKIKKHNPQDATLRNNRAINEKVLKLEMRIAALEHQVKLLIKSAVIQQGRGC